MLSSNIASAPLPTATPKVPSDVDDILAMSLSQSFVQSLPKAANADRLSSGPSKPAPAASNGKSLYGLTDADLYSGRRIKLRLDSTWGDDYYAGLGGIEVMLGTNCSLAAQLDRSGISANPADLSSIGCFDDPRVVSNLINGINNTSNGSTRAILLFAYISCLFTFLQYLF
jgi:hypothetical protein